MTAGWNRFFFELRSRESLCLVRLFTGVALFMKLTHLYGLWRIERISSTLPKHRFDGEQDYVLDGFRLPAPGFEWLPAPSYGGYLWLEWALFLLCILFTLGLKTRWVAPLLAGLLTYWLLLSQWFYTHHMMTFVLVLWVFAFSRCAEHYSLDAYLAGPQVKPAPRMILPVRQLQLLVTLIYFFSSVVAKFHSGWFSAQVLEDLQFTGHLSGYFVEEILSVVSLGMLSWFTLLVETALVVGLWIAATRRACICAGVLLHLGIDAMMNVGTFSYQMMALYIAFITPEGRQMELALGGAHFQRRQRWVRLLDWFRRFRHVDAPGPTRVELTLAGGTQLQGIDAFRELLLRMPATFLLGCLLKLPVLSQLAVVLWPREDLVL